MNEQRLHSTKNSAFWAAYGDALGFMTELADRNVLQRRIAADGVTTTIPWRRPIGGRFGAIVDLPSGCYSDDTQLRLATCRAIRSDAYFDVEAFTKIELTVWPSYALGGGRGTKEAAGNIARSDVKWFSNFFGTPKTINYFSSGGNGAAMRIQPHVWAAKDLKDGRTFLPAVIRNAITTHGHSRGILGAVFHALCVAHAMSTNQIPGPDFWREAVSSLAETAASTIKGDNDLSLFWLPVWQERTGTQVEKAFAEIQKECLQDLLVAEQHFNGKPSTEYPRLVEAMGGFKDESRGSGTKTALIASALSWMFRDEDPVQTLLVAANLLQSDTDTIASMAGAITGSVALIPPPGEIQDKKYIEEEADRLFRISCGKPTTSFRYPDVLSWSPLRTQLESIGYIGEGMGVAGLGSIDPQSKVYPSRSSKEGVGWQWFRLDFGQSIVAKRRLHLEPLPEQNWPIRGVANEKSAHDERGKPKPPQPLLPNQPSHVGRQYTGRSLDDLTRDAIRGGFEPATIGRHLLQLAETPNGIERVIAYASIIAKARVARLNESRQPPPDKFNTVATLPHEIASPRDRERAHHLKIGDTKENFSPAAQGLLNRDPREEAESIAVANIRSIHAAQLTFASKHGGLYGTLEDLISEQMLDRRFKEVISGYTFHIEVQSGADSYIAIATPNGPLGRYAFKGTNDSIVRYADGPPGTPVDQPVPIHK